MTPNESGGWTEKVLHSFGGGTDGADPVGNLIFDTAGNLYGATCEGGTYGVGTVFEMTPNGSGGWNEKKLHNFRRDQGPSWPGAGLIFDAAGNLYGTASGGSHGVGTVFEMMPNGSGGWTAKILHNFGLYPEDAGGPAGSLIFDAAGNLYGTAYSGGYTYYPNCNLGCGSVFELTPRDDGGWNEQNLHYFGHGMDGANPYGSLIFDASGNLYGTTFAGGSDPPNCNGGTCGTVFEITPD